MKEMVCIVCPVGCHLMISDEVEITGNRCPRGIEYAKIELTDPKRMITSTVKTKHPDIPRLSVKTNRPISKKLIFETMAALNDIIIDGNIRVGDIVIKQVLNTDVDIVATREIKF
jgi:CxxC motif-containing protein